MEEDSLYLEMKKKYRSNKSDISDAEKLYIRKLLQPPAKPIAIGEI